MTDPCADASAADAALLNLLTTRRPCPNCGTPADDLQHPASIELDIDLDDGDYGEEGWVTSPKAEVILVCTKPSTDDPDSLRCGGWFAVLDLEPAIDLIENLLNARLRLLVARKEPGDSSPF